MQPSLSDEGNSRSTTAKFPLPFWKPTVHYRVHKGLPVTWLFWARWIQSTYSQQISWINFNTIFPSRPSVATTTSYAFFFCVLHAQLTLSSFDHCSIWRRVQIMTWLDARFSPVSCFFLARVSKYSAQHPRSSLRMTYTSYPYKTIGKFLYCMFFDNKHDDRTLQTERQQALPEFNLLLF
jgi:hypothetical protein